MSGIEKIYPYWNISEPLNVNFSTKKVSIKDIDVNVKGKNDFEFQIRDFYFYVKGKIVKEDGTNTNATNIVTLTNNGFNLFRQAIYSIEDKEI